MTTKQEYMQRLQESSMFNSAIGQVQDEKEREAIKKKVESFYSAFVDALVSVEEKLVSKTTT